MSCNLCLLPLNLLLNTSEKSLSLPSLKILEMYFVSSSTSLKRYRTLLIPLWASHPITESIRLVRHGFCPCKSYTDCSLSPSFPSRSWRWLWGGSAPKTSQHMKLHWLACNPPDPPSHPSWRWVWCLPVKGNLSWQAEAFEDDRKSPCCDIRWLPQQTGVYLTPSTCIFLISLNGLHLSLTILWVMLHSCSPYHYVQGPERSPHQEKRRKAATELLILFSNFLKSPAFSVNIILLLSAGPVKACGHLWNYLHLDYFTIDRHVHCLAFRI